MSPFPPISARRLSRRTLFRGGGGAALGLGAAGLLTGCGSEVNISSDPNELVLWYWDRSIDPTLLEQAAVQIPGTEGMRLRSDAIGGTFDTKLRTSLAGNAYIPDITAVNANCSLYFPNEDLFTDFNDFAETPAAEAEFYDWKFSLGRPPSGRQIFWPMDTGPTGLYYRRDVLAEAGLPAEPEEVGEAVRSWEGFVELGARLRRDAGVATVITATTIFNQFLNASPERYFDDADRPLFDAPDSAVRQAWDTAVACIREGVSGNLHTPTDQNAAWASGQVAAHIEAVWWANILIDTAPASAGSWRLADQPVRAGNSGGSFLGVPKAAKDPRAASEFIRWATTPTHQAEAFNRIQLFPSTPASFEGGVMRSETDFFGDQDPLEFFRRAAEEVPTSFVSTHESQVGAFGVQLTNVESGGKEPERAWDDALAEVDRVLTKRGVL